MILFAGSQEDRLMEVACYMISDAWNHGHGKIFKAW
jgi:hypothetical protein